MRLLVTAMRYKILKHIFNKQGGARTVLIGLRVGTICGLL
jgi:hypothetical protein